MLKNGAPTAGGVGGCAQSRGLGVGVFVMLASLATMLAVLPIRRYQKKKIAMAAEAGTRDFSACRGETSNRMNTSPETRNRMELPTRAPCAEARDSFS